MVGFMYDDETSWEKGVSEGKLYNMGSRRCTGNGEPALFFEIDPTADHVSSCIVRI